MKTLKPKFIVEVIKSLILSIPSALFVYFIIKIPSFPIDLGEYAFYISSLFFLLIFLPNILKSLPLLFHTYIFKEDKFIIKRGVISKITDQIEYFKITDLRITQNPIQYMFGVCDIKVVSDDQSLPLFFLRDIQNISEEIWGRVKEDRKNKRMIPLMSIDERR